MMLASLAFYGSRIAVTELLWTAVGIVGVWVNYANYLDAKHDLFLLAAMKKNGWMKKIATSHKQSNLNRVIVNLAVILAGVSAMTAKAKNPASPITLQGTLITLCLFVIVSVSIVNPIQERRLRHKMMIEKESDDHQ